MQQDIVNDHQEEAQGWKWEQIKEIIESGELARFRNEAQMTDKYHEHKKRTAGLDMNQYVLQTRLVATNRSSKMLPRRLLVLLLICCACQRFPV